MIYKLKHIIHDKFFYTGDRRNDNYEKIGEDETRVIPLEAPKGKVCQKNSSKLSVIPDNRGTRIYLKTDPIRSKTIILPGYTDPLYTTKVPEYPRYQVYIGTSYILDETKKPKVIEDLDNRYEQEMEQKLQEGLEIVPGVKIPLSINTQLNLIGGNLNKKSIIYPVKVAKGIELNKAEFEAFYNASVAFKETLLQEKILKQEALETKTMAELIII